ncbi:MAG: hypothetical protein KDD69_13040, partial [Bdellovibrionales bacterium]|nr:hypothetical protein [Bdellovibrionales bacterium]
RANQRTRILIDGQPAPQMRIYVLQRGQLVTVDAPARLYPVMDTSLRSELLPEFQKEQPLFRYVYSF